ncbi:sensor histidine kinase [Curtobacterium sp. RRHDQ10]|uniref:sensor histidine kinase n=1 Tax=Curtobacterium phyllosphaerae TaxID=3413379 RepID=UPI003BF2D74D
MSTVPAGTAARRLRRTRILMTVAFTAVTAICLALLAGLALRIDASSGVDVQTSNVAERAGGLARGIYFDGGVLHLEPLREDELAVGATEIGVYRLDRSSDVASTAYRKGTRVDELTTDERDGMVADVVEEQGSVHDRLRTRAGHSVVWAAAPVWNEADRIGAVVIVGQDLSAQEAGHDRLALGLGLGCLVLLAAAGLAGYTLSGRAMRPATRALAQQEQFLTEAAHELRTPLATLRLSVETGDPDDREHSLGVVDRLDRLITALLTRARIEAGTFEPERTALRLDQLVQEVVHEVGDTRSVRLVTEPTVVVGDPVLLGQAARNLVDNALRHAPGPVDVTVTPQRLAVRDGGPGIPEERRGSVLRRGTGSGSGTGTGLSIVAWVSELHGATLTLSDAPGGGLVAEIAFPAV